MHIFSVLFTAQTVDKDFRTEEGLRRAAEWCKSMKLTKVYVESFRRVFIEQDLLEKACDFFENEGFEVDGCVTTVGLHKSANNYKEVGCYSHMPNHELMEQIFRRTAAVFDTIMIDDFLFTSCDCEECQKAKCGRTLEDYHSDVMHEMSVERILKPAKEVNPNCKIIIKYPNWYDAFYSRGYDVVRQTHVFDQIWAGNETREPDNVRWGRYPQTQAFYLMDWDMHISYEKCMGGWYDSIATNPETYLEQARQTILGGARESMLFCYQQLVGTDTGIADAPALNEEMDDLHKLAYLISGKKLVGVVAPKKPNDDPVTEKYIYGFLGMLGIPVTADVSLDYDAKAAILGPQAAHFENVRIYARDFHAAGKPLAVTKGFTECTGLSLPDDVPVLDPKGDNWNLMDIPQEELDGIRNKLLAPFGAKFFAPSRVALNFFDDDMEIIQNFNNEAVDVRLELPGRNHKARKIALVLSHDKAVEIKRNGTAYDLSVPPRTLVMLY